MSSVTALRERWNAAQFSPESLSPERRPGHCPGHYESYFLRANHPSEPRGFWIRYTIFAPKDDPQAVEGERWAIYFDGYQQRIVGVKDELPFAECHFGREGLDVRIGDSSLTPGRLEGSAASGGNRIEWDLRYQCEAPPLLLLPETLYRASLPKAKLLVGCPNARFDGTLRVGAEHIAIEGWRGSENHNWGSRHTDAYAWGQVAGFDEDPDAFFECATARVKLGPLWSPRMTLARLRVGDRDFAFNRMGQALRARGRYDYFDWQIATRDGSTRLEAHLHAAAESFVGLRYRNPPGGSRTCLNSKIARCEITLRTPDAPALHLTTHNRAAFEILTSDTRHGIPVVAG